MRQIAHFSATFYVTILSLIDRLSPPLCQIKELIVLYKGTFVLKAYLMFEICMQVYLGATF